jgi:hypothetical protein
MFTLVRRVGLSRPAPLLTSQAVVVRPRLLHSFAYDGAVTPVRFVVSHLT